VFSHGRISLPSRVWRTALIGVLAFSIGSATSAFGLVVNGVVEACYNNATGDLRLTTATRPCITARETAISWNQDSAAEAAARAAADTTLQNNIDAEAAARAAADTALQSNITNEAAARAAADTTLQNNIDAEAAARAAADTALQANIASGTALSGYEHVHAISTASAAAFAVAICPTGKKVLGGGGASSGGRLVSSFPLADDRWAAVAEQTGTLDVEVTAYAICATAP